VDVVLGGFGCSNGLHEGFYTALDGGLDAMLCWGGLDAVLDAVIDQCTHQRV